MKTFAVLHIAALTGLMVPVCLAAQQPAVRPGVSVLLVDPSGATIPNAPVRIFAADNTDGAPVRDTQTDSTGRVLIMLPAGSYLLQAEAAGFNTVQQTLRVVDGVSAPDLVVKLSVAASSEEVQVGSADSEQPGSSGEALVLKGSVLSTLSDDPATLQQQLQALVGGSDDGQQPQFRIDGFSGGRFPSKESIREVRINQNAFSAQYDQRGNSVIDIFTKPGTDKLHGTFYANGNADTFNSRNPYITTGQPAYHSTMIDANVNGPLGGKTSFFAGANRNSMQNNAAVNAVVLDSSFNSTPFSQAVSNPSTTDALSLRIDRQITANNTLTARYEYADSQQTNSGVGQLVLPTQGANTDTKTNTLQLGNTTVVSARFVAESRFQYLRTRTRQTPVSTGPTLIVQGSFNGGGSPGQGSEDKQDNYELQEYMSFDRGNHFLRTGARYRVTRDSNFSTANYNGQYIFPTFAAYQVTLRGQAAGLTPSQIRAAGGGASQFNLTAGTPSAVILTGDLGLYFEDEWKVRPHFTLTPGLRFETQSAVPDHVDPAPRLGFNWAVYTGKRKTPWFNLRGGAGIFYDRFAATNILTSVRQNGISQRSYYVENPDFYPAIPSPSSLTSVQPTIYRLAPDLRTQYFVSESLSASRSLGSHGNISVSFTNLHGVHLYLARNVNAPLNGVRPLAGTQNIYQYSSDGTQNARTFWTNYYLQLGRHAGVWGTYNVQFRQSDTSGANSFVSDSYNVRADYGRPASVARQRIFTGGYWEMGGGFNVSAFLAAHTATRFNITTGSDNNGDSIYNDRPSFATDLTRASVVHTSYGNFDTDPIAGQGIIPVNYGRAPGLFSLQTQFGKGFRFGSLPRPAPLAAGEKSSATPAKPERPYFLFFALEAQNVLNHVNPGTPVGQLSSPYFGRSLTINAEQGGSTAANRQITFYTFFRF